MDQVITTQPVWDQISDLAAVSTVPVEARMLTVAREIATAVPVRALRLGSVQMESADQATAIPLALARILASKDSFSPSSSPLNTNTNPAAAPSMETAARRPTTAAPEIVTQVTAIPTSAGSASTANAGLSSPATRPVPGPNSAFAVAPRVSAVIRPIIAVRGIAMMALADLCRYRVAVVW